MVQLYRKKGGKCKAPDCEIEVEKGKGYCAKHYTQIRRHGRLTGDRVVRTGCKVKDCKRPHDSHGYCQMHRQRVKKYGTPEPTDAQRFKNKGHKCKVAGCEKKAVNDGYCDMHAWRLKIYGSLKLPQKSYIKDKECTVKDCTRKQQAKDLCHTCYERIRRHNFRLKTAAVARRVADKKICKVRSCQKPAAKRDFCDMHYARWRKGQDLEAPPNSISLVQAQIYEKAVKKYGKKRVRMNDRKTIKNPKTGRFLELDILILRYGRPWKAIEVQGPSHYKPIHGKKVLEAQQLRDRTKNEECKKLGIDLEIEIISPIVTKRRY